MISFIVLLPTPFENRQNRRRLASELIFENAPAGIESLRVDDYWDNKSKSGHYRAYCFLGNFEKRLLSSFRDWVAAGLQEFPTASVLYREENSPVFVPFSPGRPRADSPGRRIRVP